MDTRASLITMLIHLLEDSTTLHQQGAGYYSCAPIIQRYNKLLGVARTLFPEGNGIIASFDDLEVKDPKDPADKMIVIQGIRVEAGQLIALLQSTGGEESE